MAGECSKTATRGSGSFAASTLEEALPTARRIYAIGESSRRRNSPSLQTKAAGVAGASSNSSTLATDSSTMAGSASAD